MLVTVVDPPLPLVSYAEAKAHLRLDDDEQKAVVERIIAGVSGFIDGPYGRLGICFGEQTLKVYYDAFDNDPVTLPYRPVLSIKSIGYVDPELADQTVEDTVYRVLTGGRLALAIGESWPAVYDAVEVINVEYVAGFEETPPAVKSAVLLMVGFLFANREASEEEALKRGAVQSLLAPYKIWTV